MLDSFFSSANPNRAPAALRTTYDEFPELFDLPEERLRTNFLYSGGRS